MGTERIDATVNYVSEQAGERWEQVELNVLVQAVVVTDDRRRQPNRWLPEFPVSAFTMLSTRRFSLSGPMMRSPTTL